LIHFYKRFTTMLVQTSSTTTKPVSFSTPSRISRMKDSTLTNPPCSFSTPSRIPRMKDSTLTRTFSFAPVNLFSVSAVFSNTPSPTQQGYNFTFVHEGGQQEAVLDKTFLTGLEKDNVRITWAQASKELQCGHEVRVDVTQLKSKSFDQKWLVFGLYFYTIFCLSDPSSGGLDGISSDSCKCSSEGVRANFKEDKLKGENLSSRTLRSALQTEDKIDLLEDSSSVQDVESLSSGGGNGNASLGDEVQNSSDASFSISFGSMSESGESGEDFSMVANPDLGTSHMAYVLVDECVELPNEGIYFDSLVWRSSILSTDASVIEAQFETVLEENGLLENYSRLAAAFDQIFEESPLNTESLVSTTPPDNDVCNVTSSSERDLTPSSFLILGSQFSEDSEKKITARTGPALASTPAEKIGDGDCSLSGFGLESNDKFSPVNMDSGYYETFSSGSLLEMSSDSDTSSNPAEKTKISEGVFRQFLFFSFEKIISELASLF